MYIEHKYYIEVHMTMTTNVEESGGMWSILLSTHQYILLIPTHSIRLPRRKLSQKCHLLILYIIFIMHLFHILISQPIQTSPYHHCHQHNQYTQLSVDITHQGGGHPLTIYNQYPLVLLINLSILVKHILQIWHQM